MAIEIQSTDLHSELDSLRRNVPLLAESVQASIESLQERTIAEIDELVGRIRDHAIRLGRFASVVEPWLETSPQSATIDAIGLAIERRNSVVAARAVVDEVVRIRHVSDDVDLRSTAWYADAVRLRDAIDRNELEGPPLAALAESRHPLSALVELVGRPDDFDDRGWQFRYDAIRDGYGTETAVAVARGRYRIADDERPQTSSLASSTSPALSNSQPDELAADAPTS